MTSIGQGFLRKVGWSPHRPNTFMLMHDRTAFTRFKGKNIIELAGILRKEAPKEAISISR